MVPGHRPKTPFGPFGDVMPEGADGQRRLPAPDGRIADVVAAVHRFDRVRGVPVAVDAAGPV